MAKIFAFLFLISCGGPEGSDGKDGASPFCDVVVKQGKSFLRCFNPNGSFTEIEIKSGQDGENGQDGKDVESKVLFDCNADIADLYVANYNVISIGDKKIASLAVNHKKTDEVFAMTTVIYLPGDDGYETAAVKLPSFEAESGKIKRPGQDWQVMTCK